jgi:hypothetical protein
MHFELICSSQPDVVFGEGSANEGFDRDAMSGLLDDLQRRGHDYEVIDVDSLSEDDRQKRYYAAVAAAGSRYKISSEFGSRDHGGGRYFGREVPALLVYENRGDATPVDVFPHKTKDGRHVTIADKLRAV